MNSVSSVWRWPGEFSKWPITWPDGDNPTLSEGTPHSIRVEEDWPRFVLTEKTVKVKVDGREFTVRIFDRVPQEKP